MVHYIIADKKMKHFYNEADVTTGNDYVSAYYPTIYAYEDEVKDAFINASKSLIETYGLEVKMVKIVEQTF